MSEYFCPGRRDDYSSLAWELGGESGEKVEKTRLADLKQLGRFIPSC